MACKHKLIESQVLHESLNISTMSIATVICIFGPGALTVTALIQRMAVILLPESEAHYIPGVRIQGCAVKENNWAMTSDAPIEIVEPHSRPCYFTALGEHDLSVNA